MEKRMAETRPNLDLQTILEGFGVRTQGNNEPQTAPPAHSDNEGGFVFMCLMALVSSKGASQISRELSSSNEAHCLNVCPFPGILMMAFV